ncbi:MAG TPA: acyl carrier protein [Bacteroidia bacterium]|nr:acyl carrier protein [Bacteroidia bacterium]HRD40036.1 acyl carrier protein [Bacteroidia bacterium]
MSINEFIQKLEAEFEDMPQGTLKAETDYRSIKGWSSMHALIIIAFIDINFNITLSGADLKSTQTVQDLYNLVQQKKSA